MRPFGRKQKTERDRSTNTREQRAKIAGVSAGTVARYDVYFSYLKYHYQRFLSLLNKNRPKFKFYPASQ